MSDDNLNIFNTSFESTSNVQAQQDAFASFMATPVTKLDADQYLVSDLDGVTEGLFGSGNMNFLMMQSGQTNESMHSAGLLDLARGDDMFSSALPILNGGGTPLTASNNEQGSSISMRGGNDVNQGLVTPENTGNSNGSITIGGASAITDGGTFSAYNATSLNNSVTNGGTPNNGSNGNNGTSGQAGDSGTNGTIGQDGSSGSNGSNGSNGTGGPGDTVTNIVNNTTTTVTELVDNTITNLGDVINNTTNNATDIINNTVTNLGDVINSTTNNVTEVINNVTDIVETIITNIFDTITNGGSLGPIGIDLSATLDNLTNLDLDIISGDQVFDVINEIIDLSPILTPIDDLLGDLSAGLDLSVILNPFQYDNDANDYDVKLLNDLDVLGLPILSGLDGLEVNLDLVEGLIGDIDIDLGLASNIVDNLFGGEGDDTDVGVDLTGILGELPLLSDTTLGEILNEAPLLGELGLGDMLAGIPLVSDLSLGEVLNDIPVVSDALETVTDVLGDALSSTPIVSDLGLDQVLAELPLVGDGNIADLLSDVPLLSGAENILLNPVEDVVGDIDLNLVPDINLFDTTNIDNAAGDTDISINLDLDIAGSNLINEALNVSLDPIEAITGDIDIDLTLATDLLGNTADGLLDGLAGGTGQDNLLNDIGNGLNGLADMLIPDTNGDETLLPSLGLDDITGLNDLPELDLDLVDSLLGEADITSPFTSGLFNGDALGGITDILGGDVLGGDALGGLTDALGSLFDTADTHGISFGENDDAPFANLADSVFGAIDSTINDAIGSLGNAADIGGLLNLDGLLANDNSDPIGMWTESTLPDAGSLLGGGLGLDIGSILPDPISNSPITSITTPLVGDVLGGLGLGGGGGGRSFGGLFG